MDNKFFNKKVETPNGKGMGDQHILVKIDEIETVRVLVRHTLKDIPWPPKSGYKVSTITDETLTVLIAYNPNEVKVI